MERATVLEESPDFSLVQGGPLFQMFRRAHLSGPAMELLWRRIWTISLFAWLPLAVLSALGGHLFEGSSPLPFTHDIEAQVRFLVALPALILAELIVHLRVQNAVRQFVERHIVVPEEEVKFRAAIQSAMRMRNSSLLELALLVLVYTLGNLLWRRQIALGTGTWYATPGAGGLNLTPAGVWYVFVSIPIFQFILLRWYLRLGIWFRFLWQVSRLRLHLVPTHPDRSAGIGFLGESAFAFGPMLFAQGAILAAVIATQVLYGGRSILSFKVEAAGLVVLFVLILLIPLTFFSPQLARTKREGLRDYGLLATRYVDDFEERWVKAAGTDGEQLLGTGDIQSLADLGNSYATVREMRVVPFGSKEVVRLAAATAIPLLPLGLTVFSAQDLLMHLVKIVL